MAGGRFSELMKKYGKVALGVHFTVSGATIGGLYIAIKNNVDVESVLEKVRFKQLESVLEKVGMGGPKEELENSGAKERNRTAEMAASSGGALALAVLCNKALFPVRVPITIAVTPSIARFLARREIIKNAL
ncbi:hypothetical protein CTI12_AA141160 [Artemisia annua]|uniref:DUF1279 domain-containing protein n=1 Tax=Artemisia annua TaxID=35608 RepID=A0A2U1PKK9_ARTAN|nr:hypothetical protein CTI12_AA141160 [Artemisia annua]